MNMMFYTFLVNWTVNLESYSELSHYRKRKIQTHFSELPYAILSALGDTFQDVESNPLIFSWEDGGPERSQKFKFGNRHPFRFSQSFPLKSGEDPGASLRVYWTVPPWGLILDWRAFFHLAVGSGQGGRAPKLLFWGDCEPKRWCPSEMTCGPSSSPLWSASAQGCLVPSRCINILDLEFWSRDTSALNVLNSWASRFQEEGKIHAECSCMKLRL